jgi:REP element-mobilizing transposase RayT
VPGFRSPEQIEQIVRVAGADADGELREFTGQANHAHLLVNLRPP